MRNYSFESIWNIRRIVETIYKYKESCNPPPKLDWESLKRNRIVSEEDVRFLESLPLFYLEPVGDEFWGVMFSTTAGGNSGRGTFQVPGKVRKPFPVEDLDVFLASVSNDSSSQAQITIVNGIDELMAITATAIRFNLGMQDIRNRADKLRQVCNQPGVSLIQDEFGLMVAAGAEVNFLSYSIRIPPEGVRLLCIEVLEKVFGVSSFSGLTYYIHQ